MIDDSRPSGGLRRTHRKSRTGCKTCRGRHIRCDEKTPICRNCERSGRQCHYVVKAKEETENQTPPYAVLFQYPQLESAKLPPQELYLLQHLASFTPEVNFIDNKYSTWMRHVPEMMSKHRFLLDCVLGVSAAHHALAKSMPDSVQLGLYYRGRGLKGLQTALNTFSEENADAVLAASIILSWYLCDWKEWSSLTHGIHTIEASMEPYKERSCFINLIEERHVVPDELQPLPPTTTESEMPKMEDTAALLELIARLEEVSAYISGHEDEEKILEQITSFALMLQRKLPMTDTSEQFEASRMLRFACINLPSTLLKKVRREPRAIITAAYFFAAAMAVQPLFPAMGAMFFGYIALQPLSELVKYIDDQRNDPIGATKYNWDEASELMLYPQEVARRFRQRLGWPTGSKPIPYRSYSSTPTDSPKDEGP
ncbi:hypothetical protein B0J14DRAFT_78958 [Halenospora varia]|nr:hypothetical protein B0J14DRAFT_78958 [Halenospora varia]